MRSIVSVKPVAVPGFRTEEPEKGRTETSLPWYTANPMSSWESTGSPIRTLAGLDLGTKRTRPVAVSFSVHINMEYNIRENVDAILDMVNDV